MSCTEEIVTVAAGLIRAILKLPPEEIFEQVKVPVRKETTSGVSITHEGMRRVRHGLAGRHDFLTQFRSSANQVGAILAQHYDLTPLWQGAGPTLDSQQETAGVRYLGRLIDACIGGAEKIPAVTPTLRRICRIFETQLVEAKIEVDWIYPLPGFRLARAVQLAKDVRLQALDNKELEFLAHSAEGGMTSGNVLLQTAICIAIRAPIQMPFAYSGNENTEILHKLTIAFLLSDIPMPVLVNAWPEPRGPSLFDLGSGSWFVHPLIFFRDTTLVSPQISGLKRVYREIDSCPREVLNSLPMRRAISAAYRDNYEDRTVDLWIALEALLLTQDEKAEVQYRMTNRAAWLARPVDLRQFQKNFKGGYNERSSVVHGGRHKIKPQTLQLSQWTFSLLKKILSLSVRQKHLPDPICIDEVMLTRRAVSRRSKQVREHMLPG